MKTEAERLAAEEKEEEEDRGAFRGEGGEGGGDGVVEGVARLGDARARGGDERARREELARAGAFLGALGQRGDGVARVRMGRREVRAAVMLKDALEEVVGVSDRVTLGDRAVQEHVRQGGHRDEVGNVVRGETGKTRDTRSFAAPLGASTLTLANTSASSFSTLGDDEDVEACLSLPSPRSSQDWT